MAKFTKKPAPKVPVYNAPKAAPLYPVAKPPHADMPLAPPVAPPAQEDHPVEHRPYSANSPYPA